MTREKVPNSIAHQVFICSGRRCAFCFGWNRDTRIKSGQICHVDRNPVRNGFDNLAFLCLEHHDLYDSKPSQSRGITQDELRQYRDELYDHIELVCGLKRSFSTTKERIDVSEFVEFPGEFDLFRLINSESICGYRILAVDEKRSFCFSIVSNHISLQEVGQETNQWLNADYEKSDCKVSFDMKGLAQLVATTYFEKYFSFIYYRETNASNSMVLVFGQGPTYYEIDYFFEKGYIMKGGENTQLLDGEEKTTVSRIRELLDQLYNAIAVATLEW